MEVQRVWVFHWKPKPIGASGCPFQVDQIWGWVKNRVTPEWLALVNGKTKTCGPVLDLLHVLQSLPSEAVRLGSTCFFLRRALSGTRSWGHGGSLAQLLIIIMFIIIITIIIFLFL